MFDKVRAPRQS